MHVRDDPNVRKAVEILEELRCALNRQLDRAVTLFASCNLFAHGGLSWGAKPLLVRRHREADRVKRE